MIYAELEQPMETFMKVLIIIPRFKEVREAERVFNHIIVPMGLGYISSALKHNSIDTAFLNLNFSGDDVDAAVEKALSKDEYSYILTGGLSVHYRSVKKSIAAIRKRAPLSKIIIGGGLVSSQPGLMWENLQPDYLVIGEGEQTIVELVNCIEQDRDSNEVNGIGFPSSKGDLVLTNPRKPIEDIDNIPWPDYDGLELGSILDRMLPSQSNVYDCLDYPRAYPLLASRSCPYACSFCYHPIGNKYRQRSIPNLLEELNYAHKRYKFNIIDVYDELFSNDKSRVLEFCRALNEFRSNVRTDIRWNCQLRVDSADEELIEAMKDAGVHTLSLGLESYSEPVLKSMRKHTYPWQIDRTLRLARRFEVALTGNFIFGDKAETPETARETLDYWKKSHSFLGSSIALGFINPYPGSLLYKYCVSKRLICNEIDFVENHISLPINMSETMSNEEFELLRIQVHKASLFFEKEAAVLPSIARNNSSGYEIRVVCPYCGMESVYRNYIPPTETVGRRDITCRNCNIRFYLLPRMAWHKELKRSLIAIVLKSVYIFWGDKAALYLKKIVKSSLSYSIRSWFATAFLFIKRKDGLDFWRG